MSASHQQRGMVATQSPPGVAVPEPPRRLSGRPPITIRNLMWLVVIMALLNGLCMTAVQRLRAAGAPIDQVHEIEIEIISINLIVFLLIVWFYLRLQSEGQGPGLHALVTRRVPLFACLVSAFATFIRVRVGRDGNLSPAVLCMIIPLGGILLATVIFSAGGRRKSSRP